MKFIIHFIGMIALMGFLHGCQNQTTSMEIDNPDIPKDFRTFYEAFHSDSTYQMEHILFPLDGRPAADTVNVYTDDFQWIKEKWKIHTFEHFVPADYEVIRKVSDSTLITEIIRDRHSGFGIKRRFAKFGEKWFLIYYDAMNPSR